MKRKLLAATLGVAVLLSLTGCGGAGECTLCGSTENTASYRNLSTNENEAICAECMEDALGSPDLCAWCQDEPAAGFYINLAEQAVFACQDCYDGLS